VVTVGVGFVAEPNLPIPKAAAKTLGGFLFVGGMALFAWALAHLKQAFLGNVEPVLDTIVASGPYQWLRHPLYLGMTISTLGLVVGLRSLWGVAAVFLFFIPAAAYRAALEENALADKFDGEWEDYASRTFFMFPPLW
jgi:protein-S-isoprenylcysteine O-methyltransferase Ste14